MPTGKHDTDGWTDDTEDDELKWEGRVRIV